MLRTLTLTLALFVAAFAQAATTDVPRETEGYGATQQEALANALVEAVRQVRGTAAGVDRSVEETLAVIAAAGSGALLQKSSKPVQDVYTESRGFVRSYEVLALNRSGDGYYARIRAVVPVFESAVADNGRQRIAVLPFRVSLDGYLLHDHGSAVNFSQRLADKLVSQLANEPSVVLVNRDFFAELGLEKAVLAADAAPEELTKIGASVGADLLLVGRVQEARSEQEAGAYGGSPKTTDEIRLSWRLIEAATGKLVRAGDIALDQKRKPQRSSYGSNTRNDFEAGELFTALAQKIGAAALAKASDEARSNTAPAEQPPAELTPGSSDRPVQW
jgi:hypothetical protein